jgi:peptidoglycan/xylan/chitin deacetylase (PgdA/CDA1 family)
MFRTSIPVLLYHRIGSHLANSAGGLSVSVEQFQLQLEWLSQRKYTAIRPAQWHSALQGKIQRPVLLTFDDAYADLCDHAFPLLRRYGHHATVFVVSGLLGGVNQWDVKQGFGPCALMNADQIRRWSAEGIEFGAHTRTHPSLIELDGRALDDEVEGSARDLTDLLGQPVRAFAYPFGHVNAAVRHSVMRTFDLAFSCRPGVNGPRTDPYRLRRSMVQPHDSLADLAQRLCFGYSLTSDLRARIRLRTRIRAAFRPMTRRRIN